MFPFFYAQVRHIPNFSKFGAAYSASWQLGPRRLNMSTEKNFGTEYINLPEISTDYPKLVKIMSTLKHD
jgi:hypothetical protein